MGRQLGEEWDPRGLGCSIHPSARLSRCVPGELGSWGQGLRLGHRHRWCRDCIHGGERAVGGMVVGSPEWSGPAHIGNRYSTVAMRLREGHGWGRLFTPMVKLVSGGCGVAGVEIVDVGGGCTSWK